MYSQELKGKNCGATKTNSQIENSICDSCLKKHTSKRTRKDHKGEINLLITPDFLMRETLTKPKSTWELNHSTKLSKGQTFKIQNTNKAQSEHELLPSHKRNNPHRKRKISWSTELQNETNKEKKEEERELIMWRHTSLRRFFQYN